MIYQDLVEKLGVMPNLETGLKLTNEQTTLIRANNKFALVHADYDQEVKIQQHQVLIITGNPEFVTTEGLGPCLGMILVSKQPQVILGFHFADPIGNNPEVVGQFLELIDVLKINVSKAEIAVAGLSAEDRDPAETREFRRNLLSAIEEKGFKRNEIQHAWSNAIEITAVNYDRDQRRLYVDQLEYYKEG